MRHDFASIPDALETRAGRTRLLSRLYRDIGLAAVAAELRLPAREFDLEVGESIERGTRYLSPIPWFSPTRSPTGGRARAGGAPAKKQHRPA